MAKVIYLSDADITEDIRELGRSHVKNHGNIYLDLQKHGLTIDNKLTLRAIIISYINNEPVLDTCKFIAIFEGTSRTAFGRLTWAEDGNDAMSRGLTDLGYDEVDTMTNLEQRAILHDIENFVWLTLAYLKTHQETAEVPFGYLPQLEAGHPRRSGRKSKQIAKKFSLFSVAKITAEGIDRDREHELNPSEPPSFGQLGRRHSVRGHFRLQAYGPQWSLRRLRWIAPFNRGSTDTVPITKLRIVAPEWEHGGQRIA